MISHVLVHGRRRRHKKTSFKNKILRDSEPRNETSLFDILKKKRKKKRTRKINCPTLPCRLLKNKIETKM